MLDHQSIPSARRSPPNAIRPLSISPFSSYVFSDPDLGAAGGFPSRPSSLPRSKSYPSQHDPLDQLDEIYASELSPPNSRPSIWADHGFRPYPSLFKRPSLPRLRNSRNPSSPPSLAPLPHLSAGPTSGTVGLCFPVVEEQQEHNDELLWEEHLPNFRHRRPSFAFSDFSDGPLSPSSPVNSFESPSLLGSPNGNYPPFSPFARTTFSSSFQPASPFTSMLSNSYSSESSLPAPVGAVSRPYRSASTSQLPEQTINLAAIDASRRCSPATLESPEVGRVWISGEAEEIRDEEETWARGSYASTCPFKRLAHDERFRERIDSERHVSAEPAVVGRKMIADVDFNVKFGGKAGEVGRRYAAKADRERAAEPEKKQEHEVSAAVKPKEKIKPFRFPHKLFRMLLDPEAGDFIFWLPNDTSFVIPDPNAIPRTLLSRHFKHDQVASLLRQLNLYGFKKSRPIVSEAKDGSRKQLKRIELHHPNFQRRHPTLLDSVDRIAVGAGHLQTKSSSSQSHLSLPASEIEKLPLSAYQVELERKLYEMASTTESLRRLLLEKDEEADKTYPHLFSPIDPLVSPNILPSYHPTPYTSSTKDKHKRSHNDFDAASSDDAGDDGDAYQPRPTFSRRVSESAAARLKKKPSIVGLGVSGGERRGSVQH